MRGAWVVGVILMVGAAGAQTGSVNPAVNSPAARPEACKTDQLALVADGQGGAFNGMSHSGTALVVKNTSGKPCSLSPMVSVRLEDAKGVALRVKVTTPNPFRGPRPMGHGPVVLPLTLAAGSTVTAEMRWVSGEVYDHSVCVEPKKVALTAGDVTLRGELTGHICGASAATVSATVTRLK